MSSAGGANFVRYLFYAGNTISKERKQALVALAYATARDQQLAPKAILIRSDIHDTTSIGGRTVKDPMGWHGTFAFKTDDLIQQEYHVASHGYTGGKSTAILQEASHTQAKKDSTRRRGGKVVWPRDEDLEEYVDSPIAYSHLPDPKYRHQRHG